MEETTLCFEHLLTAYHDEIYTYLWRMVRAGGYASPALEAQDLCQETFERAYHALPRLLPDSNVRAWLYRIATNCAFSMFRRGRRTNGEPLLLDDIDDIFIDGGQTPEEALVSSEAAKQLLSAIARLPTRQRAVLTLRYLQELPYEQIAAVMESSQETARANVYQALRQLRSILGDQENGIDD